MPMAEIMDRLRAAYGKPAVRTRRPALDELVLTILSQNTSDVNCERAYARMRERFPTWEDVRDAPEAELVDALRPGGLAVQRTPRIQAVLRGLDGLDLEWLRKLPAAEAMSWLVALPGVGPKTASCVLLFSLGVPVMPVDTHIHRIAGRLGLIPAGTGADAAHAILTAMTPPGRMLEAHLLLIQHGRTTCTARRPRCEECVLLDLCDYGQASRT
jgi:endonuclease-3